MICKLYFAHTSCSERLPERVIANHSHGRARGSPGRAIVGLAILSCSSGILGLSCMLSGWSRHCRRRHRERARTSRPLLRSCATEGWPGAVIAMILVSRTRFHRRGSHRIQSESRGSDASQILLYLFKQPGGLVTPAAYLHSILLIFDTQNCILLFVIFWA